MIEILTPKITIYLDIKNVEVRKDNKTYILQVTPKGGLQLTRKKEE